MNTFILSANVDISEADCKTKQDARKAFEACERHEKEIEMLVWDWKKANNKYLRKKKKVKKQEIIDIGAGGENIDGSKAGIIKILSKNFRSP